jgi:hypothetical protein
MSARATMNDLITLVRRMIADPAGNNQFFTDDEVLSRLDASRDDVRYESLSIAPSIVNTASTGNFPETIYADYYSIYQWWESDVILQGQDASGNAWIVLTPVSSDLIVGHWTFENNVFTAPTVPGQLPPVFATGRIYDPNCAAADLLEFWATSLSCAYDINVDGQNLKRSQMMDMKLKVADRYRRLAKPRIAKQSRRDVAVELSAKRVRLLEDDDVVIKGT